VLILIDGLPRTGKFGLVNLNNYPVEDVERIEVIRGPMSSLYGANAAGGVINVITKRPGEGDLLSFSMLGGGTNSDAGNGRETSRINGSMNLQVGNTGHRVSLDYRDANSFKFDTASAADDLLGIDHVSLTYNGNYQQSAASEFSWVLEHFDQDDRGNSVTRTGSEFEQYEREERQYGALHWEGQVGDGSLMIEGSIGKSDGSVNRSFPAPDEVTEFTQTMLQARYYLDVGDHSLLFSAGQQTDEIDISILTETGKDANTFVFMQDQWNLSENIRLVLGLRYDKFDAFGAQSTPRVTLGSRKNGLTWRVGYGEAFRAPSVLERFARFNRGRFLIVGDPDINPEASDTYEAAIGWRGDAGFVELVYHDSIIDNLIEAAPNGGRENGLLIFEYQNIAEAEISGIELAGQYALGRGFSIMGSYENLDAQDRGNGVRLNGRADHTIRVSLNYEKDAFRAAFRTRHTMGLFGIDPNDRTRSAFESDFDVMDMQLGYELKNGIDLALGIDNLLDEQVPANWSTTGAIEDPAGRFIYLSMNFNFQ
jgi:outer membrane receptor protein involved in Fe transport